jgi:hypothetical protein
MEYVVQFDAQRGNRTHIIITFLVLCFQFKTIVIWIKSFIILLSADICGCSVGISLETQLSKIVFHYFYIFKQLYSYRDVGLHRFSYFTTFISNIPNLQIILGKKLKYQHLWFSQLLCCRLISAGKESRGTVKYLPTFLRCVIPVELSETVNVICVYVRQTRLS